MRSPLLTVLCLSIAVPATGQVPNFERQTLDDQIQIGYGVDVGDVDGDGHLDILLADKKQFVWYRNPGPQRSAAGAAWDKFVMAENLTQRDNVCIAARDIDGDGKVEVAVGAQWNPGNTTDLEQSGAVFFLQRPDNPTHEWTATQLKPHEPTVHRMRWVEVANDEFQLLVLPLHGIGNQNGQGEPVRMRAYVVDTSDPSKSTSQPINTGMHLTHNFDVAALPLQKEMAERLFVVGAGGMLVLNKEAETWRLDREGGVEAAGEIRVGKLRVASPTDTTLAAAIEPMHGNKVIALRVVGNRQPERVELDDTLMEGHALAVGDLLGQSQDQIVAGWRTPNADGKVGIRMYVPQDEKYETWQTFTIDDNAMACEDLKVADLNADGKLDIVASGRATRNVVIYWNRGGADP